MSDLLHSLSLSLLFFPLWFFISIAAQSYNSTYPHCRSYNCGNINISYPFWRIGTENTTQFCGYPAFGINCSNDGEQYIPSIRLGDDSYYIHNINYETKTILLIDFDVSTAAPSDECPRILHNIVIGTLPFVFMEQNVNLTFHFNCTGVPPFAREIPCLSSGTNKTCVNPTNSVPHDFNWDEWSCDEDVVVTTVFEAFVSASRLGTEFIRAMKSGFELI